MSGSHWVGAPPSPWRTTMKHTHYETAAAQQRREARERAERDAQAYLAAKRQRDSNPPRRVWHV